MQRRSGALASLLAAGLFWGAAQACVGSEPTASEGADASGADTGLSGDALAPGPDTSTGVDAGGGNDSSSDVANDSPAADGADAARCNPMATFGAPVPLSELNVAGADTEYARLTPDELTVYFDTDNGGTTFQVYSAGRSSLDAGFAAPAPVTGVNTTTLQRAPSVTQDGLFLYAFIGTAGSYAVSVATRANTIAQFSTLSPVAGVNNAADNAGDYVLPDNSAIYFFSDRSGGAGGFDIYRSSRVSGTFQTPVALAGTLINTASDELAAVVTPDELTLYFASGRGGGLGSADMYVSRRASATDTWGTPVNVSELNTPGGDLPTWISADACVLYFMSQRVPDGGTGPNYAIYHATRGR
jgi:hypothetical protein